jgi:nitrogenase-stabilizing/protective protein
VENAIGSGLLRDGGAAVMSVLDELGRLSAAEDFFTFLDVPFDSSVVQIARLHILRRMGQYLKGSQIDGVFEGLSDADVRALCREHLEQAYQDFVKSSPIQERLFKVHKEAVEQKPEPAKPFVPLTSLAMVDKQGNKDVA